MDRIFSDTVSGKNTERPGFEEMMRYLREDDDLIVCNMDRLQHGSPVTQPDGPTGYHRKTAATRGAGVFLKEGIRLEPKGNADPMTELVFAMIGSNCAVRALAHPQAAA